MRYETKSAILGRSGKRDEDGNGPVFVHLFNENDPHKKSIVPEKFVDFDKMHKIVFDGLKIHYLLAGSDILINDLDYLEIEEDPNSKGNLIVSGKHS